MSNPGTCLSTSSSNVIYLGLPASRGYSLVETMAEGRNKQSLHNTLESFSCSSSIVDPHVVEHIADDYCIRFPYHCRVALASERTRNTSRDLKNALFARLLVHEKAKKQKTNEHDDVIDVDEPMVETPLTFPPCSESISTSLENAYVPKCGVKTTDTCIGGDLIS
ncbi:hypothetical protein Scep_009441 [Stephania cephalantha]|uniref:Uncharacterized protein n=1 Tax=Stephania cephalantha TaxID=152367 RepID=A0AAP0JU77_9MAGN